MSSGCDSPAQLDWYRDSAAAGAVARSIRMRMLGTFWVWLTAATMLCAGVACWYLANSPGLPFLVVAGLLVGTGGLWWLRHASKTLTSCTYKSESARSS